MTEPPRSVFNEVRTETSNDETKNLIEVYKMLVEMAERVSQRRQAANNFYLTVNTTLIGASSYLQTLTNGLQTSLMVSLAGIAVSVLWKRNIESYKDLNAGKFHVITELETKLPVAPFSAEWDFLGRGSSNTTYRPFHKVEVVIPWVFGLFHAVQVIRAAYSIAGPAISYFSK